MTTVPGLPFSLLAELTHRCPLACLYCANPLELVARSEELTTETWTRVFQEAAELGVLEVGLSGGEPLLRTDLNQIVSAATQAGLYTNLITSGLGLTASRARDLAAAGLNSVQVSLQAVDDATAARIARTGANKRKYAAAQAVHAAGLPLSMNVVLHRRNLEQVADIIRLADDWGARRLELANVQYYGWALANRETLMPTRDQLDRAKQTVLRLRQELSGRVELIWVLPDYFERFPKPCMGGWASRTLTVAPDGHAYPCPVAGDITTLAWPRVTESSLAWIWAHSPGFNAFRGTGWMSEPCRSCERRDIDHGGCRCQAHALTGDAARTDPVCFLSPDHGIVLEAVARAANAQPSTAPRYRQPPPPSTDRNSPLNSSPTSRSPTSKTS